MQLLFASLATVWTVAFASAESPPVLPQTCAMAYDDPHIKTFDDHSYDCQGNGDFILSKSLDSDFELQGRFYKENWPSGLVGTTTEAAVLKTGTAGEPKVEASYDRQCNLKYYINDVLMDTLETDLDTKDSKVSFHKSGKDRYFVFEDSGVSLHLTLRLNHVFGCFLNVKLCIPDSLKAENIVGLYGSPDGDDSNDYMDRQGNDLETVGKIFWGQVHDYCTQTWCIGDNSDSLFNTPGDTSLCQQPYDDKCEKEVEKAPKEVKDKCGDDLACIIDSIVAGDDGDTGTETRNDERELGGKEEIEDCDESLQMPAAVCALPDGADQYSVVTFGDAHIGAHSMYKGLAIGGTLYDASPNESGTIDKTASYLKALDTNNRFNFNSPKEVGSSCMADSMTARLEYLAMNAKNFDNGEYIVEVKSKGGTYDLDDFRMGGDSDDNGHTLAIFNTHDDIYITDEGGRQFGPTIIAPFATVYVNDGAGYVDGSIYAKALYAENGKLQLHGKTYHGPIDCGNGEPEQRVTHTCGDLASETAFARPTDDDNVGCFLEDGHQRWGWTMEIPASHSGSYTYDVFAGAGQCDTSKGELVGEVTVIYDAVAKTCEGQYMATGGHSIMEFQFYCGTDEYPKGNSGKDTVAPGQYSCVHQDTETPTTDSCVVDDVEPDSNSILHAIAHAVSCGASKEANPDTPAPTSPPTSAPTKEDDVDSGSCKAAWEQCGGSGYTGSTCCEAGHKCERDSEWWSACKPLPPSGSCKAAWEQCGGNGYTGETCCQVGYSCQADSEWWSACKPGSNPTPDTSAPTGTPTGSPTEAPETQAPTGSPTESPETSSPTASPTQSPETSSPTGSPTQSPETSSPTASPTDAPETPAPTASPTEAPETSPPTASRTDAPKTSAPTERPTESLETQAPTGSPTESPETSSPTSNPTEAPTTPEGCPEEMPDFGGACNFEGKCPYGRETCCGKEHDSVIMQCFDGTAQGFHTDACLNAKCDDPEPPILCTTDVKECDDGTVVGRTGPTCESLSLTTMLPNS